MIKAVVFDYGGVVTSGGKGSGLSSSLSQNINISREEATRILQHPWDSLVRGKTDETQFWQEVESLYGKPIATADRNVWVGWEQMKPRKEITDCISELKSEGYTVGLLSNAVAPTSNSIKVYNGYELFDPCVLSHEVGFAKPDVEIYEKLLDLLPGTKPDEVLFIDDQEKCMPPARSLGFKTIVATDPKVIISTIRETLDQQ